MKYNFNNQTYKWELETNKKVATPKKKALPYAALKREYLNLPIDNKYELYIYSAISAYCEYCGGSFRCSIEYLSDYYQIEIDELKYWINELIDKNLIGINRNDDGTYEISINSDC